MSIALQLLPFLATAPPSDVEDLVIPLVAIIGGLSIPVIAIFFYYRDQRLRHQLIEKAIQQGLTAEEIREILDGPAADRDHSSAKQVPLRKGLILIAIGVAFWLNEHPNGFGGYQSVVNTGGAGNFVAILLVGLGLAFVISDLLSWGQHNR